jgi:glycine C-acetyltransferase
MWQAKKNLIEWLKVRSRPFLFSTAMPPSIAMACLEAINIIESDRSLHDKLWDNGNYLKDGLKKLGFNIGNSQTPITPCIIGDSKITQNFSVELMRHNIYAKAIVFPTVPLGTGRIRNMPTALHNKIMIDEVISVYETLGKQFQLIK